MKFDMESHYNSATVSFEHLAPHSKSGYWFKKFVDEADAFRTGGNMHFPLSRYAEVLLTYAEAKIMMNDIDELARDCINQVRSRAGLDMSVADVKLAAKSQQEWIDLIRDERRIEFAAEGLRYNDIIRCKIAENVLNQPALGHTRVVNGQVTSLKIQDRRFSQHQYLWPFHGSSLKVEPGLTQKPWLLILLATEAQRRNERRHSLRNVAFFHTTIMPTSTLATYSQFDNMVQSA